MPRRQPSDNLSSVPAALLLAMVACAAAQAQRAADTEPVMMPAATSAPAAGADERVLAADRRRLVRSFDFDEEGKDFEPPPLPMYWTQYRGAGFPSYGHAAFDPRAGHEAPPSFRLQLDGGSVRCDFRTRLIEIVPNSDYIVFAWVRTEGIRRARAYLSAGYIDEAAFLDSSLKTEPGRPDAATPEIRLLPGSEVFSRRVGGPSENGTWHRIEARLHGGVRTARYIGLSVWLAQSKTAAVDDPPDIYGSAWFDEITVFRLPRARLETSVAGNVFRHDETARLLVFLADPDGIDLRARLTVRDVEGVVHVDRELPVEPASNNDPTDVPLPDLTTNLYEASLTVAAPTGVLAEESVRFAKLGPDAAWPTDREQAGRGFGVSLSSPNRMPAASALRLVNALNAEWVRAPVWELASLSGDTSTTPSQGMEEFFKDLASHRHELIGWIGDDSGSESGHLLDLLSSDPKTWQPHLSYAWSLYAGLINWWQIGDERDTSLVFDPRLGSAIGAIREQMVRLMPLPLLVVPDNVVRASKMTTQAPTAGTAMLIPFWVAPEQIRDYWPPWRPDDGRTLWVTIEPLPEGRYDRLSRVADLTKRLVLTRARDPDAIFLRQPWAIDADGRARPTEDYLIYRTAAAMLGGTRSAGTLTLDGQVQCYVFDRMGRSVLAMWDDYAPPTGRVHWMLLDEDAVQVDPWGRVTPLKAVGSEVPVRVGPMPTFVQGIPTWMARFRQRVAIDPPHVEAELAGHERTLRFANTFGESISGELRLHGPPGWEIRPSYVQYSLRPGEEFVQPITLTFPMYESAGVKPLLADFRIDANRAYRLRMPVWIELGLDGITVEAFAQRTGDRVIVRQTLTNRTNEVVTFEGFLMAPERERLDRLIAKVEPGQSVTKEYVLTNASELTGRRMRLGLREFNGKRMWNQLLDVP